MSMIQCLNDRVISDRSTILAKVHMRSNKTHRKVSFRNVATSYGERPRDDRSWYLSPYEFISEWDVKMLSDPQSLQDGNHRRHHAEFTEAGGAKLKANKKYHQDCDLLPGTDYCV